MDDETDGPSGQREAPRIISSRRLHKNHILPQS